MRDAPTPQNVTELRAYVGLRISKFLPNMATTLAPLYHFLLHTVPLKCNVTLARKYFARISILDALLSTSTRTNSTRVEADVEDSTG